LFIADTLNYRLRHVRRGYVQTLVGSDPIDDTVIDMNQLPYTPRHTYAKLGPSGLSLRADGALVIADSHNHGILIYREGGLSLLAGTDDKTAPEHRGYADGTSQIALFDYPSDAAVAADGSVYICDEQNNAIRKIDRGGKVTTLAGGPHVKDKSSFSQGWVDGPGKVASFSSPTGICLDRHGNLVVADSFHHCIRIVSASGEVKTLAGNGKEGHVDGSGADSSFNWPQDVALLNDGSIAVADAENNSIRVITY
jgi:hypothetical protein